MNTQRVLLPEDTYLVSLHVLFIAFSLLFAATQAWYWGATLIVSHALHERIVGDCILSKIQKDRGLSGPEDDFFFHLFRRIGSPAARERTNGIHIVLKTVILLIVLSRLAAWILARAA